MIATASAADYRRAIEVLVAHQACDAILTIFVPPLVTAAADVSREIELAERGSGKVTLASVFMGDSEHLRAAVGEPGLSVPMFDFPEDAARALTHAVDYARWRQRPPGTFSTPRLQAGRGRGDNRRLCG